MISDIINGQESETAFLFHVKLTEYLVQCGHYKGNILI